MEVTGEGEVGWGVEGGETEGGHMEVTGEGEVGWGVVGGETEGGHVEVKEGWWCYGTGEDAGVRVRGVGREARSDGRVGVYTDKHGASSNHTWPADHHT